MTAVTKGVTNPSICTQTPGLEHNLTGFNAGEAIVSGDACYIKASDKKVYKSTGAAANEASRVDGFAGTNASASEAVTLFDGVHWAYYPVLSASPAPTGTLLYLSGATAGALADIASVGGRSPIGIVLDDARVILWSSNRGGSFASSRFVASAAVTDGATVAHGMGVAPTRVVATPSVAGEMVSATTLDSTNITFAIKTHGGAAGTSQTIYWYAEA